MIVVITIPISLPVLAIGGMILRSNGGIQRPHNAVALGKAGA
jgi:hypothetical protein